MSKSFLSRGLPYCVPAIAFGNLLWLNLALAPVVFATPGSESDRESAERARSGPPQAGGLAPGSDDPQMLEADQGAASQGEPLSGRCDDSASHQTLALIDFETNATEPTAASVARLRSLVSEFDGEPPRIWVDGHADERGASEYNEGLSLLRAQAIRDRLFELGVETDRIEVRSFGEMTPVVSQGRQALHWKNRQAVLCIEKASL